MPHFLVIDAEPVTTPPVGLERLLGPSDAMRELGAQLARLAATDRTTVLLVGESGVGKGRIATALHQASPRASGPFATVTCAAATGWTLTALEQKLFGTADGRRGAFDLAHGGTVLVEEVVELPIELQPRLLELLDHGLIRPHGSAEAHPVDVRVIVASSRDLVSAVTAGRLREDLYYRLSAMPIHLPPLRARAREDLVALVGRLLVELRHDLADAPVALDDAALAMLVDHPWPGNVRELRNALERAAMLARGRERIGVDHLPHELRARATSVGGTEPPRTLMEVEREHIDRMLRAHGLNRTHTARELGISRATLIKKIREYGLAEPRPHPAILEEHA